MTLRGIDVGENMFWFLFWAMVLSFVWLVANLIYEGLSEAREGREAAIYQCIEAGHGEACGLIVCRAMGDSVVDCR